MPCQFLVGVLEDADVMPSQQEEPTLRDVMENAADCVQAELADQPLVRARVQLLLGTAFRVRAESDRAMALSEAALAILGRAEDAAVWRDRLKQPSQDTP